MLSSITFKTGLSEIITVEEVAVLFDNISNKYTTELVSMSLFPMLSKLKKEALSKATSQRNAELSKLLSEIAIRKRETKINIWKVLGTLGHAKKTIEETNSNREELEQIIYEEEQIINAYENSIRSLEEKEKKIMNGKYPRVDKITSATNIKSLKKQLVNLRDKLMEISKEHNDCFLELEGELTKLVEKAGIDQLLFPNATSSLIREAYKINSENNDRTVSVENIDYTFDLDDRRMHYTRNHISKDYYIYEPKEEDIDDELIYQLLAHGNYDDEDGVVNGLLIAVDEQEDEN